MDELLNENAGCFKITKMMLYENQAGMNDPILPVTGPCIKSQHADLTGTFFSSITRDEGNGNGKERKIERVLFGGAWHVEDDT